MRSITQPHHHYLSLPLLGACSVMVYTIQHKTAVSVIRTDSNNTAVSSAYLRVGMRPCTACTTHVRAAVYCRWCGATQQNILLPVCRQMFPFIVYPSKGRVIIIICDVGRGSTGMEREHGTCRCFSIPIMMPVPKNSPPPSHWPGL